MAIVSGTPDMPYTNTRAITEWSMLRTCIFDPSLLDFKMSTIASRAGAFLPACWQDQAPLVCSHQEAMSCEMSMLHAGL